MVRIFGGFVSVCLIFVLVVAPVLALWFLVLYGLCWLEIVTRLGPMFPAWGFWWGLFVTLFFKTYLPYTVVKYYYLLHPNIASLKISLQLIFAFISSLLFCTFAAWQFTFTGNHWFWVNWVFFAVWEMPVVTYVAKFASDEANRDGAQMVTDPLIFKREARPVELPKGSRPEWFKTAPGWVGKPDDENPLYRLWRGFLDTACYLCRYALALTKVRKADKPLGDARVASVDDTYEAGL